MICGGYATRINRSLYLNSAIDELLPWAYAAAEPLKAVG
jgi:hypothetical protein